MDDGLIQSGVVGGDGAVPSAPRGLRLSVTQEEPPVIVASWSAPRFTHGDVVGYKLTYGVRGSNYVEERRFEGPKYRFTTSFLGTSLLLCVFC